MTDTSTSDTGRRADTLPRQSTALQASGKPSAASSIADTQVSPDAYCTSGSSPTVHLIGPGSVGRALLVLLDTAALRITGVTDSTATIHDSRGLDGKAVAAWKEQGRGLWEYAGAETIPVELAIELVDADIVVDTTATDFARRDQAVARGSAVLRHPAYLALAAKDGLCAAVDTWLDAEHRSRVGYNAVLGGTGLCLSRERKALQSRWRFVACAGNASTTTVIRAIEAGLSLDEGIGRAQAAGCLEADPELDLRGDDAALKLAVVAGLLTGSVVDPGTIPCQDLRSLDPELIRQRARRGLTTRLVGRLARGGDARVAYEELSLASPLAVPPDRVVYQYELEDASLRIHTGGGIGPEATARAVLADLEVFARLCREGQLEIAGLQSTGGLG